MAFAQIFRSRGLKSYSVQCLRIGRLPPNYLGYYPENKSTYLNISMFEDVWSYLRLFTFSFLWTNIAWKCNHCFCILIIHQQENQWNVETKENQWGREVLHSDKQRGFASSELSGLPEYTVSIAQWLLFIEPIGGVTENNFFIQISHIES